ARWPDGGRAKTSRAGRHPPPGRQENRSGWLSAYPCHTPQHGYCSTDPQVRQAGKLYREKTMSHDRLTLEGPSGRLEAVLEGETGQPALLAIVCHPHPLFGGTMDNKV